ncbi:alpha/beta hydrolase [Halanaerobium salsuginis]|jgi:carboxylesterase|uniref:Carboxylesterase n=1 Tax=Halanaerobium salsuginis TaxID=29563 RepID=A0A1I4F6U0_9FIRM|nr:alpha/beta fold hydrolase [Halanaerobium salsuginis]SFL13705.1 carboxylesterase [Halanaerobium salsuginis]
MNYNQFTTTTEINPLGKELRFGLSDNNKLNKNQKRNSAHQKAVLLLHGFGGKTTNWQFIAKKIYSNLELPVYIPRLPGHGTNLSDFLNSNAEQWLRKVVDSYLYLKSNYTEIYVAGLSMGGLLATLLAAKFKVAKLSLIAPAFFTKNKFIVLTPFLKYFRYQRKSNFELPAEDKLSPEQFNYHQNYSRNYYAQTLAELYKIMRLAKKNVKKVNCPTQLILTQNDQQVNTAQIKKFLHKKIGQFLISEKTYQKSSHVIINDLEKERCADDIINFLK